MVLLELVVKEFIWHEARQKRGVLVTVALTTVTSRAGGAVKSVELVGGSAW